MKGCRSPLAILMGFVVIFAMSLALGRALYPSVGEEAFVVAPAGLAVQVGLFGAILSRGPSRAFWAGFVGAGSLALISFIWEESSPNNLTPIGSPWLGYMRAAEHVHPMISFRTDPRGWSAIRSAAHAAILVLPQWLIALAGGVLIWGIAGRRKSDPGSPGG